MPIGTFEVVAKDNKTKARRGRLYTRRGIIETPAFAPDATYAVLKHLSTHDLEKIGLQMILTNTYHVNIRPGLEVIKEHNGIHNFLKYDKPILTDSGGWQVFSLVYESKMGKVLDNGVKFRDHISGDEHFLTPQKAIDIQLTLDSDILMVLDYPVSPNANKKDNLYSISRTTAWAKISKDTFVKDERSRDKILYGIIQGANDKDLRKKSFEELEQIGFGGYGFGGVPLYDDVVEYTADLIPDSKLRYMMGSGTPDDIKKYVAMGYDLFDCVVPTRNARHGLLYTSEGEMRITNAKFKFDKKPVDEKCDCELCTTYSRSYLHHLFKIKEPLGRRLATIHNLRFYVKMMEEMRKLINH